MHERFARAADGTPDPEFAEEMRIVAQLRSGAHSVRLPASSRERIAHQLKTSITPPRNRPKFVAVACCLLVALAAVGLLSAHTALPGDPLYPVKRGIEDASVGLSGDDSAKANTRLELAGARIGELSAITARGPVAEEPADLRSALDAMDAQASGAAKLLTSEGTNETLDTLSAWTVSARARLSAVPGMPAAMAVRVHQSQALLSNIAERTSVLRARLNCTAITSGQLDSLGAVPASDRCTGARASTALPPVRQLKPQHTLAVVEPVSAPPSTRIAPLPDPVSAPVPIAPSVAPRLPTHRLPPGPPPPPDVPAPSMLNLGPLLGGLVG